MSTEVWFRNPHTYVRELVEVGEPYRVVWDRGIVIKKHIDPNKHAELYFGKNSDWRVLLIGRQGTAELDADHTLSNPKAVYPTWEHGEDIELLEEMMAHPAGEDMSACTADVPVDQRPVPNQEHRVVIANLPNAALAANRSFFRELKELQEDYPECILHVHGSYSYRIMFGMGYGSADVEPRSYAANGRVTIPAGKVIPYARTVGCAQWVHLLGMQVPDLKVPRNRCIYNIKSAIWAGEHFTEDIKFKTKGSSPVDPDAPTTVIPTTSATRSKSSLAPAEGDKVTCDTCSLATSCKYYRVGAVCSVPGTESSVLAKYFQSRDSGRIIDALGTVLSAQAKRLEKGMEDEDEFGELNPEVTKIMNQLFNNGVKLAKLVDPTLNKPLVQVNGGLGSVGTANPKQMMAAVVRAIEETGVRREDITPEMVQNMLQKMTGEPAQITQGEVAS